MARSPASDLATFLAAQSLGLTVGTNLFLGLVRAPGPSIPHNSVFITDHAGRPPDRVMSEAFEVRAPIAHVKIRNKKYATGATLSGDILDKILDGSVPNYLDVETLQSAAEYVQDSEGVMFWGLSFLCRYQQDAS